MTDARTAAPGGRLRAEIHEQPDVAAHLLVAGPPVLDAVAAEVRRRGIGLVVIAARGTSDHAAVYAQYVLGARNGLTVALAAPSLVTLYGASPHYGNALVIGLSQSGRSPDVVGVMAAARAQGALTLSITNDPASPLAMAAEHRMDLAAGEERSVAATKTYTAELLAVAMLSAALDDDGARAQLAGVPGALARRWTRRATRCGSRPTRPGSTARSSWAAGSAMRRPASGASSSRRWRSSGRTRTRPRTSPTGRWRCWPRDPRSSRTSRVGPARDALLDPVRALIRDVGADVMVLSDDPGGARRRPLVAGRAGAAGVAGTHRRDRPGPAPRDAPRDRPRARPRAAARAAQGHRDAVDQPETAGPGRVGQACLPLDQAPYSTTAPSAIRSTGQIWSQFRSGRLSPNVCWRR